MWLEQNEPIVLYHGTMRTNLPWILKEGLKPYEGWGGYGMKGVFLSGDIEGAEYWAKIQHQKESGGRLEVDRFDRKFGSQKDELLAILKVTIPASETKWLRADMEQAEDVGFEGDEADWQASLEEIGDAVFIKPIPPNWIQLQG